MSSFSGLVGDHSLKLVMFDLDGTLIDSVPDIAYAVDQVLLELDANIAGEPLVREWVGNGAAKLLERALNHAALPIDDVSKADALRRFGVHYRNHCAVDTCLYGGVIECLNDLYRRGVAMAIVTNKPREFVPDILNALHIDHFFSFILGGDDLPTKKPSPEPLLFCIDHYGVLPAETVMVGDSCNDVLAAQRAGIAIAAVDYGYNHGQDIQDEHPDIVVSSLINLL